LSVADRAVARRLAEFGIPFLVGTSVVVSAFASGGLGANRGLAGSLRFVDLGLLAALGLVVAAGRGRSVGRLLVTPFNLGFALWVGLAYASAAWSVDPSLSLRRATSLLLLYAGVVLMAAVYVRGRSEASVLALAVGAGILVVLVISVAVGVFDPGRGIQAAFHTPQGGSPARFRGVTENPDEVASYGIIVLPLALWRLAVDKGLRRLGWLAASALAYAVVIWSGTRTSLAIMVAQTAAFALVFGGRKARLVALLTLAALGLAIAALAVVRSPSVDFATRTTTIGTLGGRTEAWKGAADLIARRPAAGYGFGTEDAVFGPYVTSHERRFERVSFNGAFVHNSYLGTALQIGVGGAALVSLLLLAPLLLLIRRAPGIELPLRLALWAAIAGAAVNGVMSSYFTSVGNVITVSTWLLVALSITVARQPTTA
jgi:exopolysaccharide production protein ExoQ